MKFIRQSKDGMKVGSVKQIFFPLLYPSLLKVSLAFRTVPVATTIVADMQCIAFWIITTIDMSTQCGCSAFCQRVQRSSLPVIIDNVWQLMQVLLQNLRYFEGRYHDS